jgi:hypothetical protein
MAAPSLRILAVFLPIQEKAISLSLIQENQSLNLLQA